MVPTAATAAAVTTAMAAAAAVAATAVAAALVAEAVSETAAAMAGRRWVDGGPAAVLPVDAVACEQRGVMVSTRTFYCMQGGFWRAGAYMFRSMLVEDGLRAVQR